MNGEVGETCLVFLTFSFEIIFFMFITVYFLFICGSYIDQIYEGICKKCISGAEAKLVICLFIKTYITLFPYNIFKLFERFNYIQVIQ